jgi:glycosyltransferase involved in cell wall biosynthesis
MVALSLIIPIYNSEEQIARCLESIINQSFKDFEIVLVDDGSTDNSVAICEQYINCNENIRLHKKTNGGVSSARNFGLSKAIGEYIGFIDSDDFVLPEFFDCFSSSLNFKSADLICQGFISDNGKWTVIKSLGDRFIENNKLDEAFFELESNECFSVVWNKFFRRSIIARFELNFNESVQYGEDRLFVLSYLFYAGSILILSTSGYNYCRSSVGSLSSTRQEIKKLQLFIQEEHSLFTRYLKKFPSDYLCRMANGKYVSFNRWILLRMLDPDLQVDTELIKLQKILINEFYYNNRCDETLYREVPWVLRNLVGCNGLIIFLYRVKKAFFSNVKLFKY